MSKQRKVLLIFIEKDKFKMIEFIQNHKTIELIIIDEIK